MHRAYKNINPSSAAALRAMLVAGFVLGSAPSPGDSIPQSGNELLVVDCLLPGQIRQLGQRTTYVSPRRPARTTARDCQIRGGEYATYDRANLQTALGVWLPAAKEGDAEAGTIVGEIFERGMGSAPDFSAAAEWYRRAAEQGSTRAQINLGHLYEKGLGVARDPVEALRWYRRAAGLDAGIALDSGNGAALAENEELRQDVERLQREAQSLNTELERVRNELERASRPQPAPPPAPEPPRAEVRAEVAPVIPGPAVQAELDSLRRQLAQGTEQADELNRLLAESRERLAAAQAELERARQEHHKRLRDLEQSNAALDEQRRVAEEGSARLATMAASLGKRESEVERQRADTERLRGELASLQTQASAQSAQLTEYLQPVQVSARALMAGPEISIIDPQLLGTRGVTVIATTLGSVTSREIVGRVTAPAGLLSLSINDQRVAPNEHGVFSGHVSLSAPETPVSVVAVDQQGRRASTSFALRMKSTATAPATSVPAVPAVEVPGIDFGRYHALVIGNDQYEHLRDLTTAVSDAQSISAVLEQRYGFRTQLLVNANRYAILSALNELREKLTAEDNLLIYYAGHGELDQANNRGNWLPVDAEESSTANWIPTTAVTDILNILKARQVLVVVDSCYAGSLTRSSVARLSTGTTAEERMHWLRAVAGKRARVVLTSGGVAPVLDTGGGAHSVFAKALLEVLGSNAELLDGQRLFREVAARVSFAADNVGFDQVPEYAPIRYAGHEAGEFFFVPKL